MSETIFPDWRDLVRYSAPGPQPAILWDESDLRVMVAGLEPGGRIPSHPGPRAVFHFLEGKGRVTVDAATHQVGPGATVVVPDGAVRGVEAVTRLAFLGVRIGAEPGR